MVIIYGFGQHMNTMLEEYCIPVNEIEGIIDNELCKRNIYIGDIRIVSFEDYLNNRLKYESSCIVIGAKAHFYEIKKELLDNGCCAEENILFVDDWIKDFPRIDNFLNGAVNESRNKDLEALYAKAGLLDESVLKNAKVLRNREAACHYILPNSIVAEIGVGFGGFSKKILNISKPQKFYAIDMFSDQTRGFWGNDIFYETNITHDEWYKQEFKDYIKSGIMEMRKGISWECMETFPDDFFDYVYLDAAHDYNSVSKDIKVLKRKVKKGGIIQFNDYDQHQWYGVIPAVNELIKETNSEVLFYCLSIDGTNDIVIKLNKCAKG